MHLQPTSAIGRRLVRLHAYRIDYIKLSGLLHDLCVCVADYLQEDDDTLRYAMYGILYDRELTHEDEPTTHICQYLSAECKNNGNEFERQNRLGRVIRDDPVLWRWWKSNENQCPDIKWEEKAQTVLINHHNLSPQLFELLASEMIHIVARLSIYPVLERNMPVGNTSIVQYLAKTYLTIVDNLEDGFTRGFAKRPESPADSGRKNGQQRPLPSALEWATRVECVPSWCILMGVDGLHDNYRSQANARKHPAWWRVSREILRLLCKHPRKTIESCLEFDSEALLNWWNVERKWTTELVKRALPDANNNQSWLQRWCTDADETGKHYVAQTWNVIGQAVGSPVLQSLITQLRQTKASLKCNSITTNATQPQQPTTATARTWGNPTGVMG